MEKREGILVGTEYSVAYRVYGAGARTLICVNGAQQTTSSWRTVVTSLAGDFRVVTFDFPGQGRSPFLGERIHLPFEEQVEIVRRVAIACEATPAAVFGASWGSLVAAGYASRYAGDVDRLILAGFALRPTPALQALIARGQRLFYEDRPTELGDMIVETFGALLPPPLKRMILAQFRKLSRTQVASFIEHSKFVAAAKDAREHVDLRAIRAETLVINGGADGLVDNADLPLITSLIGRSRTRVVPDVGHFLHLERPAILDEYRAFLGAGRHAGAPACADRWRQIPSPRLSAS